jgi:hypothetical protein
MPSAVSVNYLGSARALACWRWRLAIANFPSEHFGDGAESQPYVQVTLIKMRVKLL